MKTDKPASAGRDAVPSAAWRLENKRDGERFDAWSFECAGESWFSKIIENDDVAAIICAGTQAGLKRRECLALAAPDLLKVIERLGAWNANVNGNGMELEAICDAARAAFLKASPTTKGK